MSTQEKPKVDLKLSKSCCTDGLSMLDAISPFNRAVALEFGDGPVAGVARCGKCGACFKFLHAGTVGQTRVYTIGPMPADSLQQIEAGYARVQKPSWPIWVPPTESQMKEKDRVAMEAVEEAVMRKAGPPTYVIATKHLVNGRLTAVVPYADGTPDWAAAMGVK